MDDKSAGVVRSKIYGFNSRRDFKPEVAMNRLFDLQLFGEGSPEGDPGAENPQDGVASEKDGKNGSESESKPNGRTYTDKDVDEIIDRKFAEWQKKKEKEVNEAKKLAEMDTVQRTKYERDKLQKELEELKKKDALAEMSKTARQMLRDKGIKITDDLLGLIVFTDADKTKSAIDSFALMFHEAVEEGIKERLKGSPPHRGSSTPGKLTKNQIMEVKDPVERQRLIQENRELFGY